jgi:hypothetical protein
VNRRCRVRTHQLTHLHGKTLPLVCLLQPRGNGG